MNIFEKMSAITAELGTVAKNLEVGFGKNQYKAVGEADVLAAVKPLEVKYKVYSYPVSRRVIDSGEMITTGKSNGETVEKRQLYLRVETVYRFVNIEEPSEFVDITTYGDGVDSQDKAPGKAMTYGDKYALLKAYKIQTGDDPDQKASGDLAGVRRVETPESEFITENEATILKALWAKTGRDFSQDFPKFPQVTRRRYAEAMNFLKAGGKR